LAQLQEEARELRSKLQELSESVRSAKTFAEAASGFQEEAKQQQVRLESIGLFENTDAESSICPICSNALNTPIPTANALMSAIKRLGLSIDSTTGARPRLREYIEELESKKEAVRVLMREKNAAIDGLLREEEAARAMRDLNARRAHVAGRISLWLENVEVRDDHSILSSDVERAKRRLEELQDLLATEDYSDRITSILNRIGIQMTDWAECIELEHSKNPIRLDISRLTVVVDKEDRPIPLTKMGGGQNWVGYHLVTHLALHKHFRQSQRPVPQFLFLDQPSQVYYPPERDAELQGSLEQVSNDDQLAVHRMYDLLFDAVEALSPSFQVIVLEHADLRDARFQDAVVERWRGGTALVPEDWPILSNHIIESD
jgi:PHD/YefM family antitoxin component YafN of YafNO toxin-antitoxin module